MDHGPRYRTLLVPLDGSRFGEHALPYAEGAALRTGASLELVHVQHTHSPALIEPAPVQERERFEPRPYLQRLVRRVEQLHSIPAQADVVEGAPVDALSRYVEELGADLIIMTTHGRSGLSRFWLGSVADGLVRGAEVPVLLIRPGEDDRVDSPPVRYGHVLVPLDSSRLSEQSLDRALGLAGTGEVRYTLLHVVTPALRADGRGLHVDEEREAELERKAETYLSEQTDRLRARGINAHGVVVVDPSAARAIQNSARRLAVDLIAMTTHGRGGLSRLVLGSVADKVLRDSPAPLLLYRPVE